MPRKLLEAIEQEAAALLSSLIQIDTTNPPGNEKAAADFLARELSKDGFECEVIESSRGRGNMLTRLKGTKEKPSLLLLSHLDVVPADPEEWSVHPFGGVIKDGFVWGRGALDMKSMTVIEALTMKLLKRNNVKLKGDIILAATADEEKGGVGGAEFLLKNFHDKIFANYVLNEGGGQAIPMKKRNVYTVQTAEKGILWLRIKAKGVPGHGSTPDVGDNAIIRMNKVIEKLVNFHPSIVVVPTVKNFLSLIANENNVLREHISLLLQDPSHADQALNSLAKTGKLLAEEIRPKIKMTITPTLIQGGTKENVIPSECEATFDCRVLPGQTTMEALELIKELVKSVGLEKLTFEIIQAQEPSESKFDTQLFAVITEVLHEFEPESAVLPLLTTLGTDSRFFRQAGSVCYGFHPIRPEIASGRIIKREHGIDERISIENLIFGFSTFYEVVKRFMSLE